MIIMVGVTVNVAINGGLIGITQKAAKDTQKGVEEETLQAAIVSSYDISSGTISKTKLQNNLGTNWEVTGEEGGPYGVTTPKKISFTVKKNGEIAKGWVDNGDGTFTKGSQTITRGTTYTTAEVLAKLGTTQTAGATYNGTWEVIGVEGDKIKLASTTNVKNSVTLGKNDPNVFVKDAEGHLTEELKSEIVEIAAAYSEDRGENDPDNLEFEKAIWSYRNAVETLDNEARIATGIESVRSIKLEDIYGIIGEKNVDKGSDYGKKYYYYWCTFVNPAKIYSKDVTNETAPFVPSSTDKGSAVYYTSQVFVNQNNNNLVILDKNFPEAFVELTTSHFCYNLKEEQKNTLGRSNTGYWLATCSVSCLFSQANFGVFCNEGGQITSYNLFNSLSRDCYTPSHLGVRAVVYI